MLRECAESISRIKLPLGTYCYKNFQKKFFRDPAMIVTPPLSENLIVFFMSHFIAFRVVFCQLRLRQVERWN